MQCNINKESSFLRFLKYRNPNEAQILNCAKLKFGQMPKSINELIYSLSETSRDILKDYCDTNKIEYNDSYTEEDKSPLPINNIQDSKWVNNNVDLLFRNVVGGKDYFNHYTSSKVLNAVFIGYSELGYPRGENSFSDNLNHLKNDTFKDVCDYLIDNKILNKSDYYSDGIFKYNLVNYNSINQEAYSKYLEVMPKLESKLIGSKVYNTNENAIPDFKKIGFREKNVDFEAYCNGVLLLNFDTILKNNFSGIVGVNKNGFNQFALFNGEKKYTKKTYGVTTEYWNDDSLKGQDISGIADKLTSKITSIIPRLNNNGGETGVYLSMNDLYGFGAAIYRFQIEHVNDIFKTDGKLNISGFKEFDEDPINMMKKYCQYISDGYDKNPNLTGDYAILKNQFRYYVDIAKSLNSFLGGLEGKENKSDYPITRLLTQTISNSFSAVYQTDHTINGGYIEYKDGSAQNFERIDAQRSVYNHIQSNMVTPSNISNDFKHINSETTSDKMFKKMIYRLTGIKLNDDAFKFYKSQVVADMKYDFKNSPITDQDIYKTIASRLDDIQSKILGKNGVLEKVKRVESNSNGKFSLTDQQETLSDLSKMSTFQDIIDAKMDGSIIHPASNVSSESGSKLPTCIIPSLGQNDASVFNERAKHESQLNDLFETIDQSKPKYHNFFLENGGLKGTSIKLEVVNNKGDVKAASDLNIHENFISHFKYGFFDIFRNDQKHVNTFNFQIGNYSDKSRVLDKMVDPLMLFNDKTGVRRTLLLDGKSTTAVNDEELNGMLQDQYKNYYSDLTKTIFNKYNKLGVKISNHDDIQGNITKINDFLKTFDGKKSDLLEKFLKLKGTDFVEELDYSNYKNGIRFNQDIEDYAIISHNDEYFKRFIEQQQDSFVQKLYDANGLNSELKLGYDKKAYLPQVEKYFDKDNSGEYHFNLYQGGKINGLLNKWFLVHEFCKNEYLFATVKPEYMHPSKMKFRDIDATNIEQRISTMAIEGGNRLGGMAKRNVGLTGTTEMPSRASKRGVPDKVNIVCVDDYNDLIYNLSGDTAHQDVHDGSSMIPYA